MSFVLVGNNFYYCDSVSDVDYNWNDGVRVYIKGTESYNGVYYRLTGGALVLEYNQSDLVPPTDKQDKLISATNIKTINGSSVLGSGNLSVGGGGGSSNGYFPQGW